MWDVVQGGPGLVAVGIVGIPQLTGVAAVWTSVDGIRWKRVESSQFRDVNIVGMNAITTGGPGLVAVGYGGHGEAAIWTSTDGETWQRVPHDKSIFGEGIPRNMIDVTKGGPGLVAVGIDMGIGDGVAAVWTCGRTHLERESPQQRFCRKACRRNEHGRIPGWCAGRRWLRRRQQGRSGLDLNRWRALEKSPE